MPIPFPTDPQAPVGSAAGAYWLSQRQNWAQQQVLASHREALHLMGEYSLFTLMWWAKDYDAGLVALCPTCTIDQSTLSRMSDAYQQPTRERCPDCYGTHFAGGFRAQIVRPTIWTDHNTDTQRTARGEVSTDAMVIETTEDFSFRHGDYIFRATGNRYQGEEVNSTWVRSGFDVPDEQKSVAGQISQARLEDPSSVAYLIPPSTAQLSAILRVPDRTHFLPDFSASEIVRGPLEL